MHGYDLNCVTMLKHRSHSPELNMWPHIATGADEKVIRIFDAPFTFIKDVKA